MGKRNNLKKESYKVLNLITFTQYICHQKPERTFKIRDNYFPVCSRCTGFYMGAFSYFIYVYWNFVEYNISITIIGFLMLIPAFLDAFTQLSGSRESTNSIRFITGVIGGVGLAILVKSFKWLILIHFGGLK
jgi:uncharacterized membrane protein